MAARAPGIETAACFCNSEKRDTSKKEDKVDIGHGDQDQTFPRSIHPNTRFQWFPESRTLHSIQFIFSSTNRTYAKGERPRAQYIV